MTTRLTLFDLPLDVVSLDEAVQLLSAWALEPAPTPRQVVTLNPEFVIDTRRDAEFTRVIQQADLVTADGVGIVWAARRLLGQEVPRAPGVDLACQVMASQGAQLRVFFLGGADCVSVLGEEGIGIVGMFFFSLTLGRRSHRLPLLPREAS